MYESRWEMSTRAKNDKPTAELAELVYSAYTTGKLGDLNLEFYSMGWNDSSVADIVGELNLADSMTREEYGRVSRLLFEGEYRWGYGDERDSQDALFSLDVVTPTHRQLGDEMGLAALSGVIGYDHVQGKYKNIDTLASKIAPTPHTQRVLLGMCALVAESRYQSNLDTKPASLQLNSANSLHHFVHVLADIHGDFRMRQLATFDVAVDQFGDEAVAAPAIETEALIVGYHSVESNILTNLLVHKAKDLAGDERNTFVEQIKQRLASNKELTVKVGAFGDWGSGDVRYNIETLQRMLEDDIVQEDQAWLANPGGSVYLRVVSRPDGVLFMNTESRKRSNQQDNSIFIPDDKLDEYIVTLIESAHTHGRTSPYELMALLDAFSGYERP